MSSTNSTQYLLELKAQDSATKMTAISNSASAARSKAQAALKAELFISTSLIGAVTELSGLVAVKARTWPIRSSQMSGKKSAPAEAEAAHLLTLHQVIKVIPQELEQAIRLKQLPCGVPRTS